MYKRQYQITLYLCTHTPATRGLPARRHYNDVSVMMLLLPVSAKTKRGTEQQRTNFRAASGYSRSKPGCPSVHLIATFLRMGERL
jgi:hypothetical protein